MTQVRVSHNKSHPGLETPIDEAEGKRRKAWVSQRKKDKKQEHAFCFNPSILCPFKNLGRVGKPNSTCCSAGEHASLPKVWPLRVRDEFVTFRNWGPDRLKMRPLAGIDWKCHRNHSHQSLRQQQWLKASSGLRSEVCPRVRWPFVTGAAGCGAGWLNKG